MKTISNEEDSRRECHGRTLAISRKVDRVSKGSDDVFYLVESESLNEVFYFVRYKYGESKQSEWCSCNDFTNRAIRCKHIYAVHYAEKLGVFKDTKKVGNKFQLKKEIKPAEKILAESAQQPAESAGESDLQVPPKELAITITDSRDKPLPCWEQDDYNF